MDSSVYRPLPADFQINPYNAITFSRLHPSGGPSASPDGAKAEKYRRENDRWSAPSFHKTQLKSLTAAFASLTAIIFLILVCRSIRSRAHSWVVKRKLSSDGDVSDSHSDGLVVCEGSGEEALDESGADSLQVPLKPPKAKRAKEEGGRRHSGAQHLVEDESKPESDDDQPWASTDRKRKRKARALLLETPPDEGPESPSRSEGELEAASALLELHHSLTAAGEVPRGAEESSAASLRSDAPIHGPTSAPGASQMSAPTLLQLLLQPVELSLPSAPASVATDGGAPTPGEPVGVVARGVLAASTSSASSSGREEPSTSSAAGESAVSPRPHVHPYYRLPTVNLLYRGVRRFRRERATDYGVAFRNVNFQLKRMRRLLGMQTIGSVELDELAQATAEILSYTYYYERASTTRESPSTATRNLGRRFLLLDSVIAALHVLEEPACGEWWDHIMGVIPDDTPQDQRAYVPANAGPAAHFHMDLLKRLHRALLILKTGKRISDEETLAIKRDLFCSPYSPGNFRTPRWDPWREDFKEFDGTS